MLIVVLNKMIRVVAQGVVALSVIHSPRYSPFSLAGLLCFNEKDIATGSRTCFLNLMMKGNRWLACLSLSLPKTKLITLRLACNR